MLELEYVASGVNHTQIGQSWAKNEVTTDAFKHIFGTLNKQSKFSLLFNAFTEQKLAIELQRVRDSVYHIHSDSGGLQIVTLGKVVTFELYKEIYTRQVTYFDIVMF